MWYTLDTHVYNALAHTHPLIHKHKYRRTLSLLQAHQPLHSSCQQASCLPVSPSVHGLESPLTTHTHTHRVRERDTHTHTQSHFHQAGSWCLAASSLSGCLARKILESQLDMKGCEQDHEKKVVFQVMVITRQTFWLCSSILHGETVSTTLPHTHISTKKNSPPKCCWSLFFATTHKHTHMAHVIPRGRQSLQHESDLLASLSVGMTFPPK